MKQTIKKIAEPVTEYLYTVLKRLLLVPLGLICLTIFCISMVLAVPVWFITGISLIEDFAMPGIDYFFEKLTDSEAQTSGKHNDNKRKV